MAKVCSFRQYKLKREIKNLEKKIEECLGFETFLDNGALILLHYKLNDLKTELNELEIEERYEEEGNY